MSKRKILMDVHKVLEILESRAEMNGRASGDGNHRYYAGFAQAYAEAASELRKIYEKWDRKYGYRVMPSGER
jgi:hypothetical protein